MPKKSGDESRNGDPRPRNRTVQRFVDALETLEKRGEVAPIVELFKDGCRLSNVQLEQDMEGTQGAERYWRQYRHTFTEVSSRFTRITEGDDRAVLEWVTTGTLETGRPIQYRGASVLDINGGKITAFMAYFDTRPFIAHL